MVGRERIEIHTVMNAGPLIHNRLCALYIMGNVRWGFSLCIIKYGSSRNFKESSQIARKLLNISRLRIGPMKL